MDDIVGIYTGLPEDAWYPDKINVTMGNTEIDGEYKKIDAGGGGVIFLNEETDTILKVKFYSWEDDEEVIYQKKAGEIAPEIFYDRLREVGSDIVDRKAFNGDKVQVIIMEYLNPDEWVPLRSVRQLSDPHVQSQLLEIIYKFIFEMNLKNVADFVGNTGPHLFLNEISNQIKVVDYGLFKVSTNPNHDFLMMVKEVQDVLIRWPSDDVMECYRKIMDLDEEVTDEECKGLFLYQGRLFLESKQLTTRKREPGEYPEEGSPMKLRKRGVKVRVKDVKKQRAVKKVRIYGVKEGVRGGGRERKQIKENKFE
jgi:hypothetical protein